MELYTCEDVAKILEKYLEVLKKTNYLNKVKNSEDVLLKAEASDNLRGSLKDFREITSPELRDLIHLNLNNLESLCTKVRERK